MLHQRTWPMATFGQRSQRGRIRPLNGQSGFSLDFTRGEIASLTFTRSTTATYIDTAGNFQLAAVNAPRFGCATGGGSVLGLLVEEQAVNSALRSNWRYAASDANEDGAEPISISDPPKGWTYPHGTGTCTGAASAYGTADNGYKLTQTVDSGGTQRPYVNQQFTLAAGTTYLFSVYVESITGTVTNGSIMLLSGLATTVTGTVTFWRNGVEVTSGATLTTGRLTMRFVCASITTGVTGWRVGLGTAGGATSATLVISRPQMETGPATATEPSSYIPTTTIPVTRTADFPSVAIAATPATAAVGTAACSYYRTGRATTAGVAFGLMDAGADLIQVAKHVIAATDHDTTDGTVTLASPDGVAGLNRAAFTWGGVGIANASYSLNGEAAVTDDLTLGTPVTFTIGRLRAGTHLCNFVKSFAVYPGRYDDAALAVLSA